VIIQTRPKEYGAGRCLRDLTSQTVLEAPALRYETVGHGEISISDYDALIFTSRLAVQAVKARVSDRSVKSFAVGPGTAHELRAAGFENVIEAEGTAQSLVSCLRSFRFTRALYLSAEDVTVDLSQIESLTVDRLIVYRMSPATDLPKLVKDTDTNPEPWLVPLYSARSCQVFEDLVRQSGLAHKTATATATAVFISEKVASKSSLPWGTRIIATSCDADGMAAAIKAAA